MWKPIVDVDRKQGVLQKVNEIANLLFMYSLNPPGLLKGKVGIALFMYHYWLWSHKEQYYEKALKLITASIDYCRNNELIDSFCNGAAGIGWGLTYFDEHESIEESVRALIDELFPHLYSQMAIKMKAGKYDFLHEALGIALCCWKNEPNSPLLNGFLEDLNNASLKTNDGIVWYSTLTEKDVSHQVINLSLSHGLSSIVSFLCKILKTEKVLPLLGETTRFIKNQLQDYTIYRSCFPSILSETVNYRNSRLAWCNGDLGIAYSLLRTSVILNNTGYRNMALDVLLNCCKRCDVKKEFVMDAGICHGAAGIAHIFNRVYQKTGNETFKEAALFWIDDCLKKSCFNDGLAGYKVWRKDGWITQTGLLEGIAGIGLCLLSFVMHEDPAWDECLLLS